MRRHTAVLLTVFLGCAALLFGQGQGNFPAGGLGTSTNGQMLFNGNGTVAGTTITWDNTNNAFLAPNGSAAHPPYAFTNQVGTGMFYNGTGILWAVNGTLQAFLAPAGSGGFTSTPAITGPAYLTTTNCSSSASPAVCGSAASGSVVVAAAATTVQVNTTAVTANSQVQLTFDSSLGTKLAVTCNTTPVQPTVSARTGGSNFTITVPTAPTTNPACFSYTIMN